MLMTDMWQPNERSRDLYAPGISGQADDKDPSSWESRFARVLRSEGRSYRNFACSSPAPGFGRATGTGGWQEFGNSFHQGRSCSTPPYARMNSSFGEAPLSVKYHPYHDASAVGRHDHQATGHSPPSNSADSAEDRRSRDSSLAHDRAVMFNEVVTTRERISNRRHETSCKNNAAYVGGEIRLENFARPSNDRELPRLDVDDPLNCSEAGLVSGGQLQSKSRSRNNLDDLGPCSQDVRSDFRIEKMALSSSETHLALPYPEASGPYSGFVGHRMESYPRRYSSVLDDTPVIVHQYEEEKSRAHRGRPKRSSIPVRFPPTAAGGSTHNNEDTRYSIKDTANHRQGSPLLDVEGKVRHRRSSDVSGIPRFSLNRFSDSNKESPQAAGGSSTSASGARTDRSALLVSSAPSLPPLTPTSPRLVLSSIPRPLSHPPNESSDSSFTSAGEASRPSSPSKPRAVLARSHVPKKHSNKDVCVICGDKASGYHYNTLSCEGCKGFFRRTITRNLHYHCKYGGNCVMDMWMRRKCPACRLRKCKQVGMREECLLTEHQCVVRNTRRRMKMKMKKNDDESDVQTKGEGTEISPDDTQAILASLNSEHRDLIERLVNLQDKYELPSEEDLKLLREDKMYNAPSHEDLSDAIFVHMVEMTILVTRLIVEFAKNLPGFRNLAKEDQIVLLKSSSSEVMMLRTARRYNSETNTIVFGNGIPFSPSSMAFGGLQESVESLFNFSRSMSSLYVDNAEYALLTAMCIFSVRSGLTNPLVVDKLQEVYMDVLIAYVGKRRSKCQNYLAKLLMKFVHLRTLGHEHSQTLYNLTLKRGSLPPLLTEYFDISE